MTLEATFRELYIRLQELHDAVLGVRVTVVEDRPLQGDVVLVDVLGDAADDLLGWLSEALAAAAEGRQAAAHPIKIDTLCRTLTTCQDGFSRMSHRFTSDVTHHRRMAELARLGRERGGEWRAWTRGVTQALDACQEPQYEAGQALVRCWQAIAERIGTMSVSVQATAVGQHVAVPTSAGAVPEAVS